MDGSPLNEGSNSVLTPASTSHRNHSHRGQPSGIAVLPSGLEAYMADLDSGPVTILNLAD
jgi:hypothetical protein